MFRVCRYCGQRERMSKQMYMCSHRVGVNVSKFSAFECTLVLVSSVLFRIYFSRNVKLLYVYNVCVVVVSCCYLQLLFECCFCSSGGCYSCCCFAFLFVLWFRAVFYCSIIITSLFKKNSCFEATTHCCHISFFGQKFFNM